MARTSSPGRGARRSILVGVFILAGVVLLGIGLFMIGSENSLFSHRFRVYAYFENLSGLTSGSQVEVSGVNAGSVANIEVPRQSPPRFRVTLRIDSKFRPLVRQNSVASIASQGMVGNQLVEIDPGKHPGPACGDGCTIQSKEPTSISDLLNQASGVMQTLNSTLATAGQVAENANKAIATFDARGGAGISGPEHLRETIVDAQRAANNAAEDTEALKHNFFLRGFFKRRGFYSLGQMSAEQYRKSDFAKEKKSIRLWVPADKLFRREHGEEQLTEEGRTELDRAMSNFIPYLPNRPLMVEGYSDLGSPAEEYRESEERATLVRDYLLQRFALKPDLTGAMPLSDTPPEQTRDTSWDGVCLVLLT